MRKINYFIWDFDGTLFDTYPTMAGCFMDALKKLGYTVDLDELLSHFADTFQDALSFYEKKYRLTDTLKDIYLELRANVPLSTYKPFNGAMSVLDKIVQNGKTNLIVTHRGISANEIISIHNMDKLFVEIVTSINNFPRKPDATSLNYLLDKYGIDKNEAVYIGDRKLDIDFGKNAGIKTCLVDNFNFHNGFGADYYLTCLDAMLKIV